MSFNRHYLAAVIWEGCVTLICYVPFIVTNVNKLSTKTRLRHSSVLLTSKKEIDEGLSTSDKGVEPHFAYLTLSLLDAEITDLLTNSRQSMTGSRRLH